jgi:hypothetical protein
MVLKNSQGPGEQPERPFRIPTVPSLHLEKINAILLIRYNPTALTDAPRGNLKRLVGWVPPPFGRRAQTATAAALEHFGERQFQNHYTGPIPDPERVGMGIAATAQSLSPDIRRRLEGFQIRRIGIAKLNAVVGFMKLLTIKVVEKEQRNGDLHPN